jgi:hypothetical protein
LISESGVGLSVAATRQASGRGLAAGYGPVVTLKPGKVGAGSTFASVIVVDGSFNDMRPSHEPAASTGTATGTLARCHTAVAHTTPPAIRAIQRFLMAFLSRLDD